MSQQRLSRSINSLLRCGCVDRKLKDPPERSPTGGRTGNGVGRHLQRQPDDTEPPLVDYVNMESGWISLRVPLGSSVGEVYYPTDLESDWNDRASRRPYLDQLNIYNLDDYIVRDYTPGMESSSWGPGHGKEGTIEDINSGAQSGKLKYLAQCLAGCVTSCGAALADLIKYPNTSGTQYGLYTTTQLDYYLVRIQAGVVDVAKLLFTSQGDELLSRLKVDHGSRISRTHSAHTEYRKREGYVLREANGIGAWLPIGAITTEGTPLYYGWRFSWDGDKAAVVMDEKIYHDEPAGEVAFRWSRWYSLSISESLGVPNAINFATVEAKKWKPVNGEDEFFYPGTTSTTPHHRWLAQGERYVSGYPADMFDVDGVAVDVRLEDNGNPVILAYRREQASRGSGYYEEIRAELDSIVSFCGVGAVAATLQGTTSGIFRGFFIRNGDFAVSYDEMKQMEGQAHYWEHRSISTSGTGGYGPVCARPLDFSDVPEGVGGHDGWWCGGQGWQPENEPDECPDPVHQHLSGDYGVCSVTIRNYRSTAPAFGHCAVIVNRHDCESWHLIGYASKRGGTYDAGSQDWDGFLAATAHTDNEGSIGSSVVSAVPRSTWNPAITDLWAASNTPIVYNNDVSHPHIAGSTTTYEEDDQGNPYKQYNTDLVTVVHRRESKAGVEIIRDDVSRPVNDVEYGQYEALFTLTIAEPHLPYVVPEFRAAISDVMLYTGDLGGGPPSPERRTSDPNLSVALMSYPGLFVGRS